MFVLGRTFSPYETGVSLGEINFASVMCIYDMRVLMKNTTESRALYLNQIFMDN